MSASIARSLLHCTIAAACAVACNGGASGQSCTMNDQCPSNFCQADDTCAPLTSDGGRNTGDGGGNTGDGGNGSGTCVPNHDGMITLAELPLIAGRSANFRVATNATWNTAGSANPDNTRSWDLSGALNGDTDEPITLASPAGTWWGSGYPTATYATLLSAEYSLNGVFHVDATGVTLLGVVSQDGGLEATNLKYDPPAQILALPFGAGSTWTSTSTVSGLGSGFETAYSEAYNSDVDQVGTMKTPYGTFPVLRVRTDLTRTEGVVTLAANRTFAWAAECFGTVAQVQSSAAESGEFDDPASVQRLAP